MSASPTTRPDVAQGTPSPAAAPACPPLLDDRVVVVTGGANGIGRGIAVCAARHGARAVVIADLTCDPAGGGATTVDLVAQAGAQGVFCATDVTDRPALDALMRVCAELGGADVVCVNAGIAVPGDGADISGEDFHRLVGVNLDGALATAQAAAAQMRTRHVGGAIVFTSSMGGLRGGAATVGYSTTKGGIGMMTASLAAALGPDGIRVNAVCPGIIETDLLRSSPALQPTVAPLVGRTPLRRMGAPDEVGEAVAWLASERAAFVTGVCLPVDGGLTAVI